MITNVNDPLDLFSSWYAMQLKASKSSLPSACCLSTSGLDGYPNSRFVSLKEVTHEGFIITGSLNTRKGDEIRNSAKVALAFWWQETQRQVRIQGDAFLISAQQADAYFYERPLDAQIISIISEQGKELESMKVLQDKFDTFERPSKKGQVPRQATWGGYSIKPVRIEFMTFKENRFHDRVLYKLHRDEWQQSRLQP